MKLETPKQDVSIQGDFKTSTYSVGDVAFIVDMFADKVYTYKERAVIRELSCNAYDSHVMAGRKDVKFKIHLPTQLEPWFSIRDFGLGLYEHEIRSTFAGVGISTKRDNNDTIGCFGIGSLSPYSLCDSFTVKSWKAGKLSTYSCYRNEIREPVVAMLSQVDSDALDGLEVTVNVEGRVSTFEQEAVNVFKWWDETPDINNQEVIRKCNDQRDTYDFEGEFYSLNSSWGGMVALMGNIAYRIPEEIDTLNCSGLIRFELGEISFDTARENLSLDDKTRKAIADKIEKIKDEIGQEAIAKVEAEPTPYLRAVMADKLRRGQIGRLINNNTLNGYFLPEATTEIVYWGRYWRTTERNTSKSCPVGDGVVYYLHKDRMQGRIKQHMRDQSRDTKMVVLTDEQVDEVLLDRDVLLDLEDLPKVEKKAKNGTTSTCKVFAFNDKYSYYSPEGYWLEEELDDNGQEIVYVEISRWKPVNDICTVEGCNSNISSSIKTMKECGITTPKVLGLKTAFTKTAAFKSGKFITLRDFAKREYEKIKPTTYYKFDKEQTSTLSHIEKFMGSDELDEFTNMRDTSKNDKISGICKRLGIKGNIKEDHTLQAWMDAFFVKYEMLTLLSNWDISNAKQKVARYIDATVK
jgi:hypothetical protein